MVKLFNASLTAHMRKYKRDNQMKLLNDELHNELLKEELEKDLPLLNKATRNVKIKELEEKIKREKLPPPVEIPEKVEPLTREQKGENFRRLYKTFRALKEDAEMQKQERGRKAHKQKQGSLLEEIEHGRKSANIRTGAFNKVVIPEETRVIRSRASTCDTSVGSENRIFTHGGAREGAGRKPGSTTGARIARKLRQSGVGI